MYLIPLYLLQEFERITIYYNVLANYCISIPAISPYQILLKYVSLHGDTLTNFAVTALLLLEVHECETSDCSAQTSIFIKYIVLRIMVEV